MASSPRALVGSLILALCLVGLLASGIWRLQDRPLPPVKDVFPSGFLRVGIDPTMPPFATIERDGSLTGIDIQLAEAIAKHLGLTPQFVLLGYDGLYDALATNRVDLLLSALLVEPARMDDVLYTNHYFDDGLRLISNNGIHTPEELATRSLAVEYGSTAHSVAQDWLRRHRPFTILPYELPRYALDAVRYSEAEAALISGTTLQLYAADQARWAASIETVSINHAFIAGAVGRNFPHRFEHIDQAMQVLNENGTIQGLIREGFR